MGFVARDLLAASHNEVTDLQGGGNGYEMESSRFGGHGFARGKGQFLLEGKGFGCWVSPSFLVGMTGRFFVGG